MKEGFRVAAVQMDIKGMDPDTNLDHMRDLMEKIMDQGRTDLIVFPELANSGYVKQMDLEFAED